MGGPGSGRPARGTYATEGARLLRRALDHSQTSQRSAAERLHLAPTRLSRILGGREPSLAEALAIEEVYAVPAGAWLRRALPGRGPVA